MIKHLKQTKQRYGDHFWFAFVAAVKLQWASWASLIHALIPDLMPFVAEKLTKDLAKESQARQLKRTG